MEHLVEVGACTMNQIQAWTDDEADKAEGEGVCHG
jgi:predicted flap endonuclease-1-like 5' DNA nuclease